MQPTKLIVLASNDLVRSGVRMLLQNSRSIEIVQTFSSIYQCEQYLIQHSANVLLLDDAVLGNFTLTQTMSKLREACPTLRVIVLSDYLSEHYVQRLIDYGVSGFIYKQDRLEDTLIVGIQTVADGHIFLSPQASALPYGHTADAQLNRTDLEVLRLIGRIPYPQLAGTVDTPEGTDLHRSGN